MRTLFAAFVLMSVASTATGQTKLSEEWTTYCDNGVEKIRVEFRYYLPAVGFEDTHSQWGGAFAEACAAGCGAPENAEAVLKALGNDQYQFTWQGWSRDCFVTQVWREAMMSYVGEGEFGPENFPFLVECSDGPQTIVDQSDCSLPVEHSTWGAVKALYR